MCVCGAHAEPATRPKTKSRMNQKKGIIKELKNTKNNGPVATDKTGVPPRSNSITDFNGF